MNTQSGRARPLSPDDRRAAILDAVIPLLLEKGTAVTTAEMAAAAGIAEGTIFRVFPDKSALLHAAIGETLDPEPIIIGIGKIDPALSTEEQLRAAAHLLTERYSKTNALIAMVRSMPHHEKTEKGHRIAEKAMTAVIEALTGLLERNQDNLTIEPARAAILLRGLVFIYSHQLLNPDQHMTPEQLVSALCNGILTPEAC